MKAKKKWGRPRIEIVRGSSSLATEVLTLRSNGRSWKEISTILGIAKTTARNLHQRAKNELKGEVL